jgi:hypothetical protein
MASSVAGQFVEGRLLVVRVEFAYRVSNADLAVAMSDSTIEAWPQAQD